MLNVTEKATEKREERHIFIYSTDIWYLIYLEYSRVLSGRKIGRGEGERGPNLLPVFLHCEAG
jgi:hypothetical protein